MSVSSANVADIGRKLTENCNVVSQWMIANKLKLNIDKTHYMTLGTKRRLQLQEESPHVEICGLSIEESSAGVEVLLGCQIQSSLKWHSQIAELIKKLKKRVAAVEHLRYIMPFNLRKTFVEGLFTSVISYCLPVFGGCEGYELRALQVMQNKAARIVCLASFRASRQEIFARLKWLSVKQLIFYHTALSTYRIRTSGQPDYLAMIMSRDNRRGNIMVPNSILSLAKNSYCFRGAVDWNSLPHSIRNLRSKEKFKIELKKWILENIHPF